MGFMSVANVGYQGLDLSAYLKAHEKQSKYRKQ